MEKIDPMHAKEVSQRELGDKVLSKLSHDSSDAVRQAAWKWTQSKQNSN